MARKIVLTAAEARALFDAAGQMRDDYNEWAYDLSDKKTEEGKQKDADEAEAAYQSGMEKIRSCFK